MSSPLQSPQLTKQPAAIAHSVSQPCEGGRTVELHVLSTVRVGGRNFVRCSCSWHQEFYFDDVPTCCAVEDGTVWFRQVVDEAYRKLVLNQIERGRLDEQELNGLLGKRS